MKFPGKALLWAVLPLLLLAPPLLWQGNRFANQLAEAERIRTQHTLELHAGSVQRSFDRIEGKLDSLTVFVAGQTAGGNEVDAEQFNTFAAGLHASSKWIRAFQVVSNGIITHTYPLKGNEAILGYNLLADPRPALGGDVRRAQRTGRTTITGPIELIQGGLGIMIRKPLPQTNAAPARLVAIILNIAPLLAESGIGTDGINDVRLAIRKEAGEVFFGSPAVFARQPVVCRLMLPDGAWEIAGCPLNGWQAARSPSVRLFYAAGFTVVFLLCVLFYGRARREADLSVIVEERTEALRGELAARQQSEAALQVSEKRYQLISSVASDYMFSSQVQADGRLQLEWVAGAFERMTGFTLEEYAVGGGWRAAVHPDDRAADERDMTQLRAGRRIVTELRTFTKSGEVQWVRVYAHPVRDENSGQLTGIYGAVQDITERKRAEAALRESEERLRLLGDNLPDSYVYQYVFQPDGGPHFLHLSAGVERIHGVKAETILRDAAVLHRQIAPEQLPALAKAEADSLRNLADFEMELRICRTDGQWRWLQVRSRPRKNFDGQVIWDGVTTDITTRKQAEEEIRRLHEDLQRYAAELEQRVADRTAELVHARDRAETADRTKSAFLATMSHELRTPLNSIIGFTGIILQGLAGPLNTEQNKQLEMVRNSARHLLALINDVLDISKIEAGQIEIAPAPFDLREAIEKVMHLVAPLAGKKSLPLVTRILFDAGQITSDRRRVEQILLNLLSNAIKFTEHGNVTLTAENVAGAIRISVADTGIGIKPEDLGKLFQPFRQLDSGLTRQHEGTGLGLAICKRLGERLGGKISVESRWGAGSVFQFTLPFASEKNYETHDSAH